MFLKRKKNPKLTQRTKKRSNIELAYRTKLSKSLSMVEQLSLKASLKATPWFSQHALHNRGILRIYCLQMADERRGAGAQALCLCTQFIKSQIKGSVGIQGGRKQRCKDTINPYNETSKSCPLPGAVCIWTPGRKWHALQSL